MNTLIKITLIAGLAMTATIVSANETTTLSDQASETTNSAVVPNTNTDKPSPVLQQKPPADRALMERKRIEAMELQNTKRDLKPPVATNTPTREKLLQMKQSSEQMRLEARERIATTASQIRERLTNTKNQSVERRMEAVKNQIRIMLGRFTAAILRLDTLGEKIESRIAKLAETGIDLTTAKTKLEEAKTKITVATEALENLKIALEDVVDSENPKESMTAIREMSEETKNKIKEAHLALVEVVTTLKPGIMTQAMNAQDDSNEQAEN